MRDNLAVPWPLSIPAVLDRRHCKGSRQQLAEHFGGI